MDRKFNEGIASWDYESNLSWKDVGSTYGYPNTSNGYRRIDTTISTIYKKSYLQLLSFKYTNIPVSEGGSYRDIEAGSEMSPVIVEITPDYSSPLNFEGRFGVAGTFYTFDGKTGRLPITLNDGVIRIDISYYK